MCISVIHIFVCSRRQALGSTASRHFNKESLHMNCTTAPLCTDKGQQGFTLVELAIVMIIIGLLIAGVLKGQQLISNARVTATIAQIKGIDAATSTFRDMYEAVPGDLPNPNNRLPNCGNITGCNPGAIATLGNNRVDSAFNAAPTAEGIAFWVQLSTADLISGIDATRGAVWGGQFPQAEIAGGYHVAYWAGNAVLPSNVSGVAANTRSGHYLALHGTQNGSVANTGVMNANAAARIDRKIDDGVANSGSVLSAGAAACNNATGLYAESTEGDNCNLYIRFQQ